MNAKLILITLVASLTMITCTQVSNNDAIAKKKIYQKIDLQGMGMLKDIKVINLEMIDDTTYLATHTFLNPVMTDNKMRVTRVYVFSRGLDSIVSQTKTKTEMYSLGEWIEW
jgi:hypothetical protein